ncbi:Eco57I restriction-modification methylase domain-containing protein [Halarsenatibacter silvermanii]|uniref:site-specific DNA-methyltransferase (adenine-specific) n=1 Tax=Halarsenatibacter silvermanii TaxID=321763 RepID=A0A1G9U622_9FIRM|nr:DNA methyltransferase [Halarsenatibacter silvermanii]SDM55417.1 Methyltransferase domain-containing protein [Halarsenatibacter silvermanii]
MPGLFNKKIIEQNIHDYYIENFTEKLKKIRNWKENLANIKGLNEQRLQSAFLSAIFEDILGYKNDPAAEQWTMEIECSTDLDAKTPDGILGFYKRENGEVKKEHKAVIELKGPQVALDKDQKREGSTYKSPVDQAFSYTNRLDKCKWVIVSNFIEIRLYKVGRSKEYNEVFHLQDLVEENEFKKFHYLLCSDHLITEEGKSETLRLSGATNKRHEDISVEFYNLYKNMRINLFEHLKENNPDIDFEVLLEKAQKFLDRIIFICFCEDKQLLPNDVLHQAIERGKDSFEVSDTAIWNQIRGVFRAVDEGSDKHNINSYDGGLFAYDEVLDELTIKDDFFDAIYEISEYDFDSDVDVNILGHIFEQSITDIEQLKADIRDDEYDKNESRRKKEGIYYTPKYITSYIVENAVGGYLEDKKEELGYYDLPDIEEAGSKSWKTRYTQQHIDFFNEYEEELKDITILDPACGSGAFLNQAFDFLLEEHRWLNKQRDLLRNALHESNGAVSRDNELQASLTSQERIYRNILKNNLYGVDLNRESVEITKLSLWLKTANKQDELTNLDDNIKCGNSLIDDPEIAGEKAFDWEDEFPDIMEEGGFDCVIGNPPFVRHEDIKWMKPYLKENYQVYFGTADLYCYFIEKSLRLLRKQGYFSFIVST